MVFRVHCTFPNIETEAVPGEKIAMKWGKNQRKKMRDVGDDVFRVQCTFPNMESEAVLNVK